MEQEQPTSPEAPRPWYYQSWFLLPAFVMGWPLTPPLVLWPVWGVLILRSPWHNHTLLKGLGWSMLIVGAVLVIKNLRGGTDPLLVFMMVLPGILLTVMTQVMWNRYRLEHGLVPPPPPPIPPEPSEEDAIGGSEEFSPEDGYTRRSRARRRLQRRRDRSNRPPAA